MTRLTNSTRWLELVLAALLVTTAVHCTLPMNDFVQWWGGARLLTRGGNPYSTPQLEQAEDETHLPTPKRTLLNPPWTLIPFLPLSRLPYVLAVYLWTLLNFVVIILCFLLLRARNSGSWALFVWTPLWICFLNRQLTILVLLGLVLFQMAIQRGRDLRAGAALALVTLKPHLVYLLWPALLLWCHRQHRWRILAAMGVTVALMSAAVMYFNPAIFLYYFHQQTHPDPAIFRGTHSLAQLFWAISQRQWTRFAPVAVGGLWFLARRTTWEKQAWDEDTLPWLILVSLATTPYSHAYDQALSLLIIPATLKRLELLPTFGREFVAYVYCAFNLLFVVVFFTAHNSVWLSLFHIFCLVLYFGVRLLAATAHRKTIAT